MASLGDLMVRVGAEIDPSFNSSFDGASGKMQDFSDGADSMAGQYSAAMQKIVAAQEEADQAWDTAKGTFAELQQAFDAGSVSFETLARGAKDLKNAFDDANPSLKAMKEGADDAESSVKTLAEAFTEITGVALTFEALKEAALETVTAFGNEQAATIALTAALGGNKEEAGELIEQAKGLGDALGQTNSSMIQATQRLIAFGEPADQVNSALTAMGTAALAVNQPLDTVSQRFDLMAATGTASGRGLVSLGLTINDLGAAMGLAAGTPSADITTAFKGIGDTADRMGILVEAVMTKFPTLAADASDSVNNAWNKMKNATDDAFVEIGAQLGGFSALVTPIIQAVKGLETGFIALLIPIKTVVDAVVGGGGIILSTLTGLGEAAVLTAQGKFGEAADSIKTAMAKAASYATGFVDNIKSDWTSSAAAIAQIWDTSMKTVGDGTAAAVKPMQDLSASQKDLNTATKDLLSGATLLGDVWRKSQQPILDVGQATTNLAVAQAHQQQAAGDLLKAQNDLSNALNQDVPTTEAVTEATAAQQTAYKNVQSATKDVAQAQKDLQAAQKLAEQATKDQAQTDSDYATMLNTLGKTALLSYADAISNVSTAKSKYVEAVTNEITIQAQLDGLVASGKQGTTDYTIAQGALTAAHQQVAQALKDLNAAQTTASTSQSALSAATKELLSDQTSLDGLYKDHLTGDTTDLQTAVAALSTARQNEATAANDLVVAEGNLAVVKATATSSETDLKTATDNARIARENLTAATKNTADQEGILVQQFGLSKTAADVLSGATVSLTEVFKDMGLKSASSLQDLADVATKEYNLIASSGTASANQLTDAQIKALQAQKTAYIANGSDLSSAQQATLDQLLNQQSYFNQQHADQWHALYTTIDNQVMQLSDKLVQDLFEGNGSFGKTALKALEDLGAAVVNAFIAPATKAIANFIAGSLSDLMGKLGALVGAQGFGGVQNVVGVALPDALSGLDDAFGDLSDTALKAASDIDDALGGAGSAAGGAGGALGAVGAATSSILSSISSIVGMVTGAISAITGIIQVVQGFSMEDALKAIEKETARMAIYLGDQGGNSIQGLMWRLVNDIEFGEMEKALNIISADIDKVAGPFWAYGLQNLKDISNNTYWSLQKLQEIDNKTGNSSGSVNVEGTDLSTVISALDIINNTLVAESQTIPWFQTALQNINNGVVACAGWLQGILNPFQSGTAKVGGSSGSEPLADLATFIGANFSDLENWLFNAFGRSMALPALPAPEQIPSSLAGGTSAAASATGSSTAAASASTAAHAQQSTAGPTAAAAPDIISFLTAQFTTTDGILSKAGDGIVAVMTGANVMLASLGAGVRQVDASLEKIGVGILAAFGTVTTSLKTSQELVSANENKILDQIVILNARESQELSLMGLLRDAVGQFATMTANQLSELINVTKMSISVPAAASPSLAFAGAAAVVNEINTSNSGGHTFNFPNARITGVNDAKQALDQAVNELRRRNRII